LCFYFILKSNCLSVFRVSGPALLIGGSLLKWQAKKDLDTKTEGQGHKFPISAFFKSAFKDMDEMQQSNNATTSCGKCVTFRRACDLESEGQNHKGQADIKSDEDVDNGSKISQKSVITGHFAAISDVTSQGQDQCEGQGQCAGQNSHEGDSVTLKLASMTGHCRATPLVPPLFQNHPHEAPNLPERVMESPALSCQGKRVAKETRIIVEGSPGQVMRINVSMENVGSTSIKYHWLVSCPYTLVSTGQMVQLVKVVVGL